MPVVVVTDVDDVDIVPLVPVIVPVTEVSVEEYVVEVIVSVVGSVAMVSVETVSVTITVFSFTQPDAKTTRTIARAATIDFFIENPLSVHFFRAGGLDLSGLIQDPSGQTRRN